MRVRTTTLQKRKLDGEKIVALTAYDYPMARLLDESDVDVILVGDSLGTAVAGLDDTLGVTMDQMVYHTRIVSRAVKRALLVADMPFLSYQVSPELALQSAGRLVAEGGAHAVKLEGPADRFGAAIEAITRAGIPVMGHIGLTPQSVHQIGGYKVQGVDERARERLLEEALGLQRAGCFSLVLELVVADVAGEITERLTIPTIGIGSGVQCDGQVLIMHDMLGFGPGYRFVKTFFDARSAIAGALAAYAREVREGSFPGPEHERRCE